MQGITVEQVRAADVADLAASLLGLSDGELLGVDAQSAEALVTAAQRVISAVTAVQVVGIEAWGAARVSSSISTKSSGRHGC